MIKENINQRRVITAEKPENFDLINVTIFEFDKNHKIINKIKEKVNIKSKKWILKTTVSRLEGEIDTSKIFDEFYISLITIMQNLYIV